MGGNILVEKLFVYRIPSVRIEYTTQHDTHPYIHQKKKKNKPTHTHVHIRIHTGIRTTCDKYCAGWSRVSEKQQQQRTIRLI